MEIFFKDAATERVCFQEAALKKSYGAENGRRIRLRFSSLRGHQKLSDVPTGPPEKLKTKQNGKGIECIVAAGPNAEIVFAPLLGGSEAISEPIDLSRITQILIKDIRQGKRDGKK